MLFLLSSIVLLQQINSFDTGERYEISELNWKFRMANGSMAGNAIVPGDIYMDLEANHLITVKPLFGDNDTVLRWVPRMEWIYETDFVVPSHIKKTQVLFIDARGLDTIATVNVNGLTVAKSVNQFVPLVIPIKNWKYGTNTISIAFESPIDYVFKKAKHYESVYRHGIPPECPVSDFRGECHVNFIRKIQASFSWDWGPSFPTVGIWQPISVKIVNSLFVDRVSANVDSINDMYVVLIDVPMYSTQAYDYVQVTVNIDELGIWASYGNRVEAMKMNHLNGSFAIAKKKVEQWWPNGFGEQKLYVLRTVVGVNEEMISCKPIKIGFRTVKLIESLVDPKQSEKGRNFYLEVNDLPIFLKGSNWIPISAFPARDHQKRLEFLMQSAKEANMNALRVWGGGRYESDEFYDLADELGIMIWQDMMFACALYPVDKEFLNNVGNEIRTQVYRLRNHPSIIMWAGNNENELAVKSWFFTSHYSTKEKVGDYLKLYKDLIGPIVAAADHTRPYILSSPTNGIETLREGGVSGYPQDPSYGDIHFYNEILNLWNPTTYEIPRCASEYGVQSYPRKWRNRLENRLGNTMCALYWQLNDIWAAPTWASIDFELSWKPLHYYARRFFTEILLSMYLVHENKLEVFVVSDAANKMTNCQLKLDLFSLSDGFNPSYSYSAEIEILPQISKQIPIINPKIINLIKKNAKRAAEKQFLIRGQIFAENGEQIGYDSIVIPAGWFKAKETIFGTAKIDKVERINDISYRLEISADQLAPLTWIEPQLDLIGWLSDNAFTMTSSNKTVIFTVQSAPTAADLSIDDFKICTLRDCGIERPTAAAENPDFAAE